MGIDWSAVVQTLTATTVIVAAIAWLAKTLFAHFLQRDLALTEARLQAIHDLNMSQLRAETERELVRLKALTDRELETLRIEANRALETHRAELTAAESKHLRITNEILDGYVPRLL